MPLRTPARSGRWAGLFAVAVAAAMLLVTVRPAGASQQPPYPAPVPVFAHYYIWFNPTSWNRAKTDFPTLGRYSSDEAAVMHQHIEWAKEAGIRGFIVSWKSTDTLNSRLDTLVRIANDEDFNLAIVYQGLDFYRNPLPVKTVKADLAHFADRYAREDAFALFGQPVVIWRGTWEFTPREIADVTRPLRDELLILASETDAQSYGRLAHLVDGDAYYWSSVDPSTSGDHEAKLGELSGAVHSGGGLWIAPAAPGFDSRMLGGTTVVERRDGKTLRLEMAAALRSSPDMIGLISWNEFSENTHVEPSQKYGSRYLHVLAEILRTPAPTIPDFDSSAPSGSQSWLTSGMVLTGLTLLTLLSFLVIGKRRIWRKYGIKTWHLPASGPSETEG